MDKCLIPKLPLVNVGGLLRLVRKSDTVRLSERIVVGSIPPLTSLTSSSTRNKEKDMREKLREILIPLFFDDGAINPIPNEKTEKRIDQALTQILSLIEENYIPVNRHRISDEEIRQSLKSNGGGDE